MTVKMILMTVTSSKMTCEGMGEERQTLLVREDVDESSFGLLDRARKEAGKQLWLAFPLMGTNVVQFALQVISIMFVGHLGELQLAGASIATSVATVTGNSLLLGLAGALETLCGQAYGAKQYAKLGIYMQRAFFVLGLVSLPIAVLWLNIEHVLVFFSQAPDISFQAGVYTRWLLPNLFAYVFLQPLIKFLQAQSVVLPMFLCSTLSLLFHLLLCYVTIYKLGMGFVGAALSTSICCWLNVIFLVCIVAFTPRCRKCWEGFSMELFEDIIPFLKLAVSSAVMLCLEWWSFELVVLLSGVLPNPQLETSVFAVVINLLQLCYMFPFGISAAGSTRVSNELGAGHPFKARFSFFVAMSLATLDAVVVFSALMISRNVLGKAFSNEPEVISYVAEVTPYLALLTIMDAYGGTVSGIARGCGWQAIAAASNLVAYYVIGLPIGYVLAFVVGLRGKGLLFGVLSGVSTQAVVLLIIASTTNWRKQAELVCLQTEEESSA